MRVALGLVSLLFASCGSARDTANIADNDETVIAVNSQTKAGSATRSPAVGPSLPATIKKLTQGLIARANASDEQGWTYVADSSSSRDVEFTNDDDIDAVAVITLCEKEACQPTSTINTAFLLKNKGTRYDVIRQIEVGIEPKIGAFSKTGILIESKKFGDDDPTCCPSITRRDKLVFPK